jgi:O-antigen/teichoic acid export membrane protein
MFWLTSGISRPLMEAYLGLSAIGIYAVANRLSSAVGTVSSIVALAWNNSVLDEYGHEGFDRFYNNYLRVISSIYFLCCALIILFSRLIIELFSSPEYYAASLYLPVLTINMTLFGLASSVGSIYAAVKKSKYFFYSSAVGAIISLISIYPLIKYGGLMGVCVSAALSSMGTMIFRWYYASKFVKLDSISFYSFGLLLLFVMAFINHSLPPIACYIIQLSIILFFLFYSKGLIKQVWNVICIKKRV